MSIAEKLKIIAENEQKVYEAGFEAGCSQGGGGDTEAVYNQGFAEGKKAEYDRFWDFLQGKGERTIYDYAFYYMDITDFYPKHDLNPTTAQYLFRDSNTNTPTSYSLTQRLKECGVTMDFSNCTNVRYCFYNSPFTELPQLDLRKAGTTANGLFCGTGAGVKKIEKVILTEEGQPLTQFFGYASSLEEVEVEGAIADGNLDIKNSLKLTLGSLKSILTALKDYSGTDKEYAYTVTLSGANWAVLGADGQTAPNGASWVEYVSAKGWNNA